MNLLGSLYVLNILRVTLVYVWGRKNSHKHLWHLRLWHRVKSSSSALIQCTSPSHNSVLLIHEPSLHWYWFSEHVKVAVKREMPSLSFKHVTESSKPQAVNHCLMDIINLYVMGTNPTVFLLESIGCFSHQ